MPQPNQQQIEIVALTGSLREKSTTRHALRIALESAAELGARTRILDLRDYDLVMCDGRDSTDYPADVHRLRDDMGGAQGIIIGTPEYHNSFSGVLKNAIDLMGFDQFQGKVVGLLSVAGGAMGGADSLNSLRMICRSLHSWVVPQQVSIPQAWKHFEDDGTLTHEGYRTRLIEMGKQVARFSYLHSAQQTLDFLKQWEESPHNPGGD